MRGCGYAIVGTQLTNDGTTGQILGAGPVYMERQMIRFRDIASRITGVSIPIFGVSWDPPASEREIVRQTFIFLEDRRALYVDYAWEVEAEVAQSVLTMRAELTAALKQLPEESEATGSIKAIRAACREYLDTTRRGRVAHSPFVVGLERFRAMVGVHVAYLAVKYGIDIDGELSRVIPAEFRDARYLEG
jgi:hypothetical protein